MEFRTKVELPVGQYKICHSDLLMLWGSCFSENMGKLLIDNKFNCNICLLYTSPSPRDA